MPRTHFLCRCSEVEIVVQNLLPWNHARLLLIVRNTKLARNGDLGSLGWLPTTGLLARTPPSGPSRGTIAG
jgi:hypothetical protein